MLRDLSKAALAFAIVLGCAVASSRAVDRDNNRIEGSGVKKTETRDLKPFTQITLKSAANIDVQIGDKQSVTVEGDDNILPVIETNVKDDGQLMITSPKNTNYEPKNDVKVTITVPSLTNIRLDGAGDINVHGMTGKEFSVDLRGAGNIKLDGKIDELNVELKGAGNVDTTKLTATNAKVNVSGAGNCKVQAKEKLDARVSGVGNIQYTGNPKAVLRKVTGQGDVREL